MTPEQLARRNAALARARAANTLIDQGGAGAAAAQTEFDAAMSEVGSIDAEAATAHAAAEAATRRATALAAATNAPQPRRTLANSELNGHAPTVPARPVSEADPTGGFSSPRAFLSAVMASSRGGSTVEQRNMLRPFQTAGSDEASGFSDGYGGFLIPPSFSPQLLMVDPEADPTAGRTTMVPMTAPILRVNARTDKDHTTSVTGGLRFYRRAESDAANSSRMQLEQIELKANPLTGLSFATNELLQDSPISFVALLEQAFGDEYNATLLQEKLFGTGVGQYLGVMNSPALITVAKAAGQATQTIVYDNILSMRASCWGYSKAVWIANHMTFPQLAKLSLPVGTAGSAVYMPSAQDDRPDTLLGRPIFYSEFAQVTGTVGDIMLVNWSQFLEAAYQSPQMAQSLHVRFVNNENAFRVTARNDGQPWWRSALTPRKGNSLSPYIALATR